MTQNIKPTNDTNDIKKKLSLIFMILYEYPHKTHKTHFEIFLTTIKNKHLHQTTFVKTMKRNIFHINTANHLYNDLFFAHNSDN